MPAFTRVDTDCATWPQTPAATATKIRTLRRELADARLIWRGVADELKKVRDEKRVAELRLRQITDTEESTWFTRSHNQIASLPDDHVEVQTMRKRIADANAELARLEPILATRAAASEQLGQLIDGVEKYFDERLRGLKTIETFRGPAPALLKRESAVEAVERCRGRLAELDANRDQIIHAPWPSRECKERARAEIEKLSERGRPNVGSLNSERGGITWSERPFKELFVAGRMVMTEHDPAALPLVMFFLKDTIIEKIEAAIDAQADDKHALSAKQRAHAIEDIDREALQIQRAEEHHFLQATAKGANLTRRPAIDARALLQLADTMPPQR